MNINIEMGSNTENKTKSKATLWERAMPYVAVVLMNLGLAGLGIFAKFGMDKGMSYYTFSTYRNILATLVFAPFAYIFERKTCPKMTILIFFYIMLLGLLGPVLDLNLFYGGMKYTTATFSTAIYNIIPAITFVMAWILRLEKVNLRKLHSQAKLVGTIVALGGAMMMTFVKGSYIGLPWTKEASHVEDTMHAENPLKGSLMVTASCFSMAAFNILQAITLKSYPAGLTLTTLICLAGSVQGALLTFIVEKGNMTVWYLGWDIKLLCAVYGGLICSGGSYYVSGIVMETKGPVFVTAFNPLCLVIVAILGSLFLSEQVYIGRVLGAIVIVIGLYVVLWGESKDAYGSKLEVEQITPTNEEAVMKGNTTIPKDEAV